jgi:hypothetical protein
MPTYDDAATVVGGSVPHGVENLIRPDRPQQGRLTVWKSVGPPNTPQEIKRLRRENMDLCRKMGQPVVVRHMYEREDVEAGIAKQCPACYDNAYDQVRNDCPVCYGFGFVSTEDNPFPIWIDPAGLLVETETPDPEWVRAPRYGGFALPYLTWLVEPDVAVDVFRINEQGVMVKTYDATGVAPWFPDLSDNDLCVNVTLQPDGFTIIDTFDRYQLKLVQQVTIRGFGKRSRYSSDGNPFKVAQTFQMSHSPDNQSLYNVPVDEPWY